MGLFSSSSSSPSSSTAQPLPTRQARKACWDSRDAYYACLSKANVVIPPGTDMSDGRAPAGKAEAAAFAQKEKERERVALEARDKDPCKGTRGAYEDNCAKSWIDYFNKRRVLEERQRMMYAAGAQPLANAGGATASR